MRIIKNRSEFRFNINENGREVRLAKVQDYLCQNGFKLKVVNGEEIYTTEVTEGQLNSAMSPQNLTLDVVDNNVIINAWLYKFNYSFGLTPRMSILVKAKINLEKEMNLDGIYGIVFKKKLKKKIEEIGEILVR